MSEFVRRPFPESPVRTTRIVFPAPGLDDLFRFHQRRGPVRIQALRPEGSIERLHVGVVGRLPRRREVDAHTGPIPLQIHRLAGELGTAVTEQHFRCPSGNPHAIEYVYHIFPF